MNFIPTPYSSCLHSIAWQHTAFWMGFAVGPLVVTFRTGAQFRYDWVPAHVWNEFSQAPTGRTFRNLIKGRYPSECLQQPKKADATEQTKKKPKTAAERAAHNAKLLGFGGQR